VTPSSDTRSEFIRLQTLQKAKVTILTMSGKRVRTQQLLEQQQQMARAHAGAGAGPGAASLAGNTQQMLL
jgi:hypothetical protein